MKILWGVVKFIFWFIVIGIVCSQCNLINPIPWDRE